jgi:adenylate kinase
MHLVLTGRTGSGKSTVARLLAERFDVPIISSGDIAREIAKDDPATGMALRQGSFAPEHAMRVLVRQRIEEADLRHGGWVLDGFPRTVDQLICLMQWTTALPTFIEMGLSTWACLERLNARGRDDDNPDSLARRLESFEEKTTPMIAILEEGGVLHYIPYEGMSAEDAAAEIERTLT